MNHRRWQKKQISMIRHSALAIGCGQTAAFLSVYWLSLGQNFKFSSLWMGIAMFHSFFMIVGPNLFIFGTKRKKHLSIRAINLGLLTAILLWAYPTLELYGLLEAQKQSIYAILIAGVSSATVASVLHSRRMSLIVVSGIILPFTYSCFISSTETSKILSVLSLVFVGALINQIILLHKTLKKEFLLTEQNKKLLYENKQNTERLVEASKMVSIGRMAGGIAHEINTPLAVISGSMSLIKNYMVKEDYDRQKMEKTVANIEKTVKRIARIISGLKVVSRDSIEILLEEVKTQDIYEDILGLCGERFKGKGVSLSFNIDADGCPIFLLCDQVQLSQVLLNLLNNAYDAIQDLDEKWITVDFKMQDDRHLIVVTDSGIIKDESLVQKIFDPFYSSKPVGEGTGLGLSLSRSMIENHGGSLYLDIDSDHTCFVIELPRKLEARESLAA